jgi:hypothetical protein
MHHEFHAYHRDGRWLATCLVGGSVDWWTGDSERMAVAWLIGHGLEPAHAERIVREAATDGHSLVWWTARRAAAM